jgi:hypothetical protein
MDKTSKDFEWARRVVAELIDRLMKQAGVKR